MLRVLLLTANPERLKAHLQKLADKAGFLSMCFLIVLLLRRMVGKNFGIRVNSSKYVFYPSIYGVPAGRGHTRWPSFAIASFLPLAGGG